MTATRRLAGAAIVRRRQQTSADGAHAEDVEGAAAGERPVDRGALAARGQVELTVGVGEDRRRTPGAAWASIAAKIGYVHDPLSSRTRDAGSRTGSCRSSRLLKIENSAVLAPMPRASVVTATSVNVGLCRSPRRAMRRSCRACSNHAHVHTACASSRASVRLPRARWLASAASAGERPSRSRCACRCWRCVSISSARSASWRACVARYQRRRSSEVMGAPGLGAACRSGRAQHALDAADHPLELGSARRRAAAGRRRSACSSGRGGCCRTCPTRRSPTGSPAAAASAG